MPAPLSSTPLKSRLLGSASAAALVFGMVTMAPNIAVAQQAAVDGVEYSSGITTNDGDAVDDEDLAIQNGFTEAAGDATITINVNNTGDESATIINDANGNTLSVVVVDEAANPTIGSLTITGDVAASNGGAININVGDDGPALPGDTSGNVALILQGNVSEAGGSTVSIQLGFAGPAPGGTATLVFDANGDDRTVDAAITDAPVTNGYRMIVSNNDTTAGSVTFTDTVTLDGNVPILIGNAPTIVDSSPGFLPGGSIVATFEDDVTLSGGSDSAIRVDATNIPNTGEAIFEFGGETLAANQVELIEDIGVTGVAGFRVSGATDQAVNAAVVVQNSGSGFLNIEGAARTVTFADSIGVDGTPIGVIRVDDENGASDDTDAVIAAFQGNVFAEQISIDDGATAQFLGSMSVLGGTTNDGAIVVGNGTNAAQLTFTGDADHIGNTELSSNATLVVDATGSNTSLNSDVTAAPGATNTTLQITGDNTVAGGNRAIFAGAGSNTDAITLIDIDAASEFNIAVFVNTLDIDADVLFADALTAENVDIGGGHTATTGGLPITITGDLTGGGTLDIDNASALNIGANGEMSTVSIAAIEGGGDVIITPGSAVTITSVIGGGDAVAEFVSNGAPATNTTLTINTDAPTAITTGDLTLNRTTVVLGANIGAGDTVFDVGTVNLAGDEAPVVQLSAAFTNGTLTFIDEGNPAAAGIDLSNADTALTNFEADDTGTDLLITATALTAEETAGILGISTEQAAALRQAALSGDTTLVDLLTTALNTGGADATQAARQVGVQSETVGGGSTVSREMAGQQQRITQDRTGGFRADDPRFVTAFAASDQGETGFAGGDLDGPYTPMGPRYANSVWGQVYGGTALADGTTALAGFDAGFGGAMIGIDGALSDDVVIGAFAGYGFADVDGDGAGNAQLEVSAYQAGVYAGYTGASFYVDAFAAYAMLQNDTQRTTLGPNTVTGEFDASQISVGLSGGAPIAISANGYLTPNASLTWNHYDADGYTETGVGANTVAGFTANTLTGTIGARLHAVYEMSDGSAIIPELSAGLLYDIVDDDGRTSATFVGGGAAYTVSGTEISNIGAAIGAGLTMRNDVWSVGLSYDGDIRSDFMSHTGRAEVRMRF